MTDLRARRALLPVFTPTAVPADELAARTVGRKDVIARIVTRLKAAATSDERPHVLLVGPRGSGKTHLLRVVVHEAKSDERIAQRLAFLALPEDAPEIASYADLLYAIVERLLADGGRLEAEDTGRYLRAARAARRDAHRLERLVEEILGDRVLVLLVENLDRLFADFGATGQGRMRAFAETSRRVALLASTPLLFSGVSDHEQPWYGAFHVEHLADLTTEEGGQLLAHLAEASGDLSLQQFLGTPAADDRLHAVTRLTGGSPRMWTVLAGCLTVELLDELVPLVKALLDELVPYYQERLSSLSPIERKLVVELCRTTELTDAGRLVSRAHGMWTVSELAERCGIDRAVAATSLGRLHELRWVQRSKPAGTDQRTTWYEIREPMLRHHLQYRDDRGEMLRVIVTFLREWYSPLERRRRFAEARAGTLAERYLRHAVMGGPASASDGAYINGDLNELLVGARCLNDAHPATAGWHVHSPLAAIAAEAVAHTVRDGGAVALAAARSRIEEMPETERELLRDVAAAGIEGAGDPRAAEAMRQGSDVTEAVAALPLRSPRARTAALSGLETALAVAEPRARDHDVAALALVTSGWRGACGGFSDARDELQRLLPRAQSVGNQALRLAVSAELAFFMAESGDLVGALELGREVLRERQALLGSLHVDTLTSRLNVADWVAATGGHGEAIEMLEALVPNFDGVLGSDDPRALSARAQLAGVLGEHGDWDAAATLWADVAAGRAKVLGDDDPATLWTRGWLANAFGECGDDERAKELWEEVAADCRRALGAGHRMTLWARHAVATHMRTLGDHSAARRLLDDLLPDAQQVLDAGDLELLTIRHNHAVATTADGDRAAGRDLLVVLLRDSERTLGPAHPNTVLTMVSLVGVLADMEGPAAALPIAMDAYDRSRTGSDEAEPNRARTSDAIVDVIAAADPEAVLGAEEGSVPSRAFEIAMAENPAWVLAAWWLAIIRGPSERIAPFVAQLARSVGTAIVSSALDVALVSSAWLLHRASADVRAAWIDSWMVAMDDLADVEIAPIVLPAVRAHFDGDPAALLRLPVELREIVSELLAAAEAGLVPGRQGGAD